MIEFATGNLLEADVEALVNTVNTVGVMGKGIALQFKQAYPDNYQAYRAACNRGEVQPGTMFVFATGRLTNPRSIINFPTKQHWKNKSRMQDIEVGLQHLVTVIKEKHIASIAIPALGCNNGGLRWEDVRPRIEAALAEVPRVHAFVYAPGSVPAAAAMPVATKRPNMTPGRAAIIRLMEQYQIPGDSLSMLEIQKLAYFLQESGEPLNLNFVRYHYGPYAEKLHYVLQHMEGHYIRGYGDRSRSTSIRLLEGSTEAAEACISQQADTRSRLQQVARLIEGYETPYGLELLATIHWLAIHEPSAQMEDAEAAVASVHAWSKRKQQMFRPEHIRMFWQHLQEQGWMERMSPPAPISSATSI